MAKTSGILWAVQHGGSVSRNEVLRAYDATNLAKEVYNSDQAATVTYRGLLADRSKVSLLPTASIRTDRPTAAHRIRVAAGRHVGGSFERE
jgi:hypothetical protein